MSDPVAESPPQQRYSAAMANEIEQRWQTYWTEHGTWLTPNPSGPLHDGWEEVAGRPKVFLLDMFPYPSGSGLHVGHPLGFIATDVYGRFLRMTGHNVLHTIGYDAFGLPAEQYAIETGQHPRATTEANIANMRRQLGRLGLAHDPRRAVATTDPSFVRWTQWIFLQIFHSWYDPEQGVARPIQELVEQLEAGTRPTPDGRAWSELDDIERRRVVDEQRLAYRSQAMVNWCPGLGTVLANEEVTADGRSERGNFPVFRRPLTQWMLRITAFADRLLADLDTLDWPEPVKLMQRNWIGRSEGANVRFPVELGPAAPDVDDGAAIEVFTTRPDTLFGATFMVLAPEHDLVDALIPDAWPEGTDERWTGRHASPREAVDTYRAAASRKSELDRQIEDREKTGVFTGAFATNPVNDQPIPVFIADYVLMGYGTGAIMAVPGQDQRDWDFAERFGLPIIRTVQPPADFDGQAYIGEGPAISSGLLDGLGIVDAKRTIIDRLEQQGAGTGTVTYKLRDWLFSRQRYWGEPFPILYDEDGMPVAVPEDMLPVDLPDLDDYAPVARPDDEMSEPEPPLGRVHEWAEVVLDLGDGPRPYRRELNTMPQWAGSCWYYLRYLDPTNEKVFVDPDVERYWMLGDGKNPGGVDLYVGGVEHAVLHLLYSRFWHKVLFDLGHVSTPEPFQRLYNQGYIQAFAYTDDRGFYVPAEEVEEKPDGTYEWQGQAVQREYGKMGKSLKNSVSPDEMYESFGGDTLRLYEMSMGPLDASRPWSTKAVAGVHRLLQRAWRAIVDEETGEVHVLEGSPEGETRLALHRAIAAVRDDYEALRFNTAVARITELVNQITKDGQCHRETAEALTKLLAPLAPHVAEELWARLGHEPSVGRQPFPVADESVLASDTVTLIVQVNGKVRERLDVSTSATAEDIEAAARASEKVAAYLKGAEVRRVVTNPPTLVNFVVTAS
ncbi:MAG: leucyl-tRNA synthetase [Acidimicrobiaceae bacterium]